MLKKIWAIITILLCTVILGILGILKFVVNFIFDYLPSYVVSFLVSSYLIWLYAYPNRDIQIVYAYEKLSRSYGIICPIFTFLFTIGLISIPKYKKYLNIVKATLFPLIGIPIFMLLVYLTNNYYDYMNIFMKYYRFIIPLICALLREPVQRFMYEEINESDDILQDK